MSISRNTANLPENESRFGFTEGLVEDGENLYPDGENIVNEDIPDEDFDLPDEDLDLLDIDINPPGEEADPPEVVTTPAVFRAGLESPPETTDFSIPSGARGNTSQAPASTDLFNEANENKPLPTFPSPESFRLELSRQPDSPDTAGIPPPNSAIAPGNFQLVPPPIPGEDEDPDLFDDEESLELIVGNDNIIDDAL